MTKTGKQAGAIKGTAIPSWIRDKENQREWNDRFIEIMKRDFAVSDATVSIVSSDDRLSQLCATKIRTYIDKDITAYFYEERKARQAKYEKQLETAVAGIGAAINLYVDLGNEELAKILGPIKDELSQALGRCKDAFPTKRHGRDRDHAILFECHSFLEAELAQRVTYVTLANLVNAGFEADGNLPEEPVGEEQIRKNIANFKRNNPLWHLYGSTKLPPRLEPDLVDPETKYCKRSGFVAWPISDPFRILGAILRQNRQETCGQNYENRGTEFQEHNKEVAQDKAKTGNRIQTHCSPKTRP